MLSCCRGCRGCRLGCSCNCRVEGAPGNRVTCDIKPTHATPLSTLLCYYCACRRRLGQGRTRTSAANFEAVLPALDLVLSLLPACHLLPSILCHVSPSSSRSATTTRPLLVHITSASSPASTWTPPLPSSALHVAPPATLTARFPSILTNRLRVPVPDALVRLNGHTT